MMEATTFVYPWVHTGRPDSKGMTETLRDLTYSIRSIEANYAGLFRIVVVGDPPPTLGGIIYIPHQRTGKAGEYPKALDAVEKMQLVLDCPHVTERFVYMGDDVVLNRPADLAMLSGRWGLEELGAQQSAASSSAAHTRHRMATAQALRQAGHTRVWNYETHLPRVFEKRRMRQVLARFPAAAQRLLLPTLYWNHHHPEQPPVQLSALDNVRAFFAGYAHVPGTSPGPPTTDPHRALAHFQQHTRGKLWVVWNDRGMHGGLRLWMRQQFGERCSFEGERTCAVWDPTTTHATT